MERRTSFHLFVIAGVLALAMLLAMAPLQAKTTTKARFGCRFQGMQEGRWTEREVKATIRCAVNRWPVDLSTALYIAERESHFQARALNEGSQAMGVYQHLERYWDGRVAAFLEVTGPRFHIRHPSAFNARANVLVSIKMAHDGGWGPWSL